MVSGVAQFTKGPKKNLSHLKQSPDCSNHISPSIWIFFKSLNCQCHTCVLSSGWARVSDRLERSSAQVRSDSASGRRLRRSRLLEQVLGGAGWDPAVQRCHSWPAGQFASRSPLDSPTELCCYNFSWFAVNATYRRAISTQKRVKCLH